MAQETLNVTIDSKGNIEIRGEGFVGSGCEKVIDQICDELGKTTRQEKTADFYKKAVVNKQVNSRG